MTEPREFTVAENPRGERLDVWLHQRLPEYSRSALTRLIEAGSVLVDRRQVKPHYKPRGSETVRIEFPPEPDPRPKPEPIPLNVLFEDEHLLVIDKEPGRCVHPSAGHPQETLVNGLLHHCGEALQTVGEAGRPGIVHRLDRGTSGCLIAAKTEKAHAQLTSQFADRSIEKTYLAIACGEVRDETGDISANIARHPSDQKRMAVAAGAGRPAHTTYRLLKSFSGASLLELGLLTGRTHQIRVHLKHLGFPVFGDAVYGKRQSQRLSAVIGHQPERPMLHAWKLAFRHPENDYRFCIQAYPPEDLEATLHRLANQPS